jgi:hypothetical protein
MLLGETRLYNEFQGSSKLTSSFEVITQIWLILSPWSLQVVSEPPSNARSCGTEVLHDVALTRTLEI